MRRLLMRGLRPGRHVPSAQPRTGGAVAERNIVVARRLQGRLDDELVDAIGFQAVDVPQQIRRLDPRRPTTSSAGMARPSASSTPSRITRATFAPVKTWTPKRLSKSFGRGRKPRRQVNP